MANNKQKELNKILENCISCCITQEGTDQVVKEKVLGKARSINIVMTRCVCVNQLIQAGYNICTIAEALHKTPTSIRKIKRVSAVFEKFSKAYNIALKEATTLNQLKD